MILIELQGELAEEFSPSLTNPSGKALKDVDMYDFLDYFIRVTKHNNNSVQELAQSLQNLREFEGGKMPPPSTPNPPSPSNTPPTKPNNPTPSVAQKTPNKTTLQKDLSTQEIKEAVQKWDLDNPNPNDKLLVSLVQGDELATLSKEFDFKGNYAIAREIDAEHIHHALQRHSNLDIETSRNQIPITKDDIFNYQNIIKTADTREVKGDKIIYKKQVNGHYVVVEEALTGKNKINFVTMYKPKGNIMPPSTPAKNSHDLDRTLSGGYNKPNSTTPNPKSQITSNDLEALNELKTYFKKNQKNSTDDIAQAKKKLAQAQDNLKEFFKKAKKLPQEKRYNKLRLEADLREAQARLTEAYSHKAYFKAQEKELKNIETTLKEYQTSIDSFMQNPSAKNLAPLHKIKKKLYATLESTQYQMIGSTPDNLNRTLNEALETTLEAISQSRKAITLKKTSKSAPNPVQEFREFITATRNDIDYVLGNFDKDTALKVLDEKLASTISENQKRFLARLKNELAQTATPDNIDIIADKNLKQGIKMENQMDFLEISTQDTKSITELRDKASQKIDKLLGKDIINKNDGRVAQISKNGRNKILSGAALRKSRENGFSKEEHFIASEHIKELYENSTAIKSEPPRNNSNDIKEVHKYISNLHINNKEAQALLTIKEIVEYGNRIYSLELQELRPVSQMQTHTK